MILLLFGLLFVWSCRPEVKPGPGFSALTAEEVDSILQRLDPAAQGLDSWLELRVPLKRSLEYVKTRPQNRPATTAYGLVATWLDLRTSLERLLALLPELDRNPKLLREEFHWLELKPRSLLTGYYEPLIEASLTPEPDYPYPVYGLPRDLKIADLGRFHPRWQGQRLVYRINENSIEPYPDRRAIEEDGSLQEKAEIIAWAKDLVDVFFLQIQGSGRLLLPDGSVQPIGYAGKNGRPYRSLGRHMAEKGLLAPHGVSMRSIRDHLQQNPELVPEILYSNPSYVFFRLRGSGPYGAMNQELTSLVSLAVDTDILALGSVLMFQADLPDPGGEGKIPLCGPGLAQDIGGAIQNHHLDLFCGFGQKGGALAGGLKEKARVWLLLAKD
ncbi:MAG: murein transglycosylase A [Desulfohalobiaceae bacterium]|nr:murein transglycosylase A [Desulfohalobiaceae bacterium]